MSSGSDSGAHAVAGAGDRVHPEGFGHAQIQSPSSVGRSLAGGGTGGRGLPRSGPVRAGPVPARRPPARCGRTGPCRPGGRTRPAGSPGRPSARYRRGPAGGAGARLARRGRWRCGAARSGTARTARRTRPPGRRRPGRFPPGRSTVTAARPARPRRRRAAPAQRPVVQGAAGRAGKRQPAAVVAAHQPGLRLGAVGAEQRPQRVPIAASVTRQPPPARYRVVSMVPGSAAVPASRNQRGP